MTTNRTSWELMQRKQLALSCAKDAKANYAQELEQLRLTMDYLRSLRHWLGVASRNKTLKARKAVFAGHLERINAMADRRTAIEYCKFNLVPASCETNIRNAISWAHTATSSPTFKDWQECCDNTNNCIGDAICQLDVVRSWVKYSWKRARANMITARKVIDTCAKDILHPVALPKAKRKEMVRRLMNTVINDSRAPIRTNSSLYFFANLVHIKALKRSYGFTITYSIWNRALYVRAMYPRC